MSRKRISFKYQVPSVKELESDLDERVKFFNMTKSQFLDMYIKGRIGEIIKSTVIILREIKRIKKAKKCIRSALSTINKGSSENVKIVTKQYYRNLLDSSISRVKVTNRNFYKQKMS